MKQNHQCSLLICGAGLTGLALALATVKKSDISIIIIDNKTDQLVDFAGVSHPKELRALALSHTTHKALESLDFWAEINKGVMPLKHIHVSDKGNFGVTHLHATDYGISSLGCVVEMRLLQQQLLNAVKEFPNIQIIRPVKVDKTYLDNNKRVVECTLNDEPVTIESDLAVAADGSNSHMCQQLGIAFDVDDYKQTAIVANVGVDRPHENIAYERFTANGPIALLPVADNAFSLVWTCPTEDTEQYKALDDRAFLTKLQQAFGYRGGCFTWASARQAFPLKLITTKTNSVDRAVVIGNAAHTIHPIAGQGFNLSLRDALALADIIEQNQTEDVGSFEILQQFEHVRKKDQKQTIRFTDTLVKTFSNKLLPLKLIRGMTLWGLDFSPVKHKLAKKAMGF